MVWPNSALIADTFSRLFYIMNPVRHPSCGSLITILPILCLTSILVLGCSLSGDNTNNPLITANQEVIEVYDLRIEEVELLTPTPAFTGQGVAWRVWVQNIGTQPVPGFWVVLKVNGRSVSSHSLNLELPPGRSRGEGTSWECGAYDFTLRNPGVYQIHIETFPFISVEDFDQSNNVLTSSLEVIDPPPDYYPPSIPRPAHCSS